jgi:hypothetical protein
VLLLLLTTAALAACSHRHRIPEDSVAETEWSLTVTNHHWLDVAIYVMYDGQRQHVGTVTATQNATFLLPAHMIAPGRMVRIEANPIGATRSVTTEGLTIRGGQHVEWTLETGLERSSVAVW